MLDVIQLEGFKIIAADGTYLGKISQNPVDPDSIKNVVGRYGSVVSPFSIFNEVGNYGSVVSPNSPFNVVASDPPQIIDKDGNCYAYLTKNVIKTPQIDPDELKSSLEIE